jgi:putative ABC transport system substrate-binding protein
MISRRQVVFGATSMLLAPPVGFARQPGTGLVIGVLWHAASIKEETPYFQSLIEGFEQLGYVSGRNITLVHRFPDEKPELFTTMAAELVSLNPDVLIGVGGAAPYLKKQHQRFPSYSCTFPILSVPGW